MSQATRTYPSPQSDYFDLHTVGCGYLSRVRWVNPSNRAGRQAKPFLCCAINAMHGKAKEPSYTYFDLRVSAEDCKLLIAQLERPVSERKQVFVAFKVGDIYPHQYDVPVRDGPAREERIESRVLIKGRLIALTHVKVDSEVVYQLTPEGEAIGALVERVTDSQECRRMTA